MPKPRFFKMSDADRHTLISAAAETFATAGYQAASLNALLRSLDMSKGTFYHAFHDKGDLYAAVLQHYAARVKVVQAPHASDSVAAFWLQVQASIIEAYAVAAADPVCEGLFRDVARLYGQRGLPEAALALMAALESHVRRFVEAGRRVGAVRDDVPAALLTQMVIGAGAAVDVYIAEHTADIGEAASLVTPTMDMLRRMVAPSDG